MEIYTVKPGDTLWDIAERKLGDPFEWRTIADLNQLRNPDLIYPGDRLKVPVVPKKSTASSRA